MRTSLSLVVLLLASLALAQPVTIGGVTYDYVDAGEAFTPAPQPAQDWSAPAPTKAERAAGMLAFVAPDPGDYRPTRVPQVAEHAAKLSTALTPGEAEPVCFAVRSLAALQGLTVTVEAGGAPVTADIRQMHCWPQRTGWRSRQWYMTPELLLPCAGGKKSVPVKRGVLQEVAFDVPADTTQGFWITLHAPENAKAGTYTATVTLASAGNAALKLPLSIEVLPFKLQRPADRSWLLYGDSALWRNMSDAQVLAQFRDFRAHGMDGLIEMPFGAPDLSRLKEGKVTFDAAPYRKYAGMLQQVGMMGPNVIGTAGAGAVRDVVAPGVNLEQGEWPAEVKQGIHLVARAAMEATKGLPRWYYYGVDEPTGDNTYAIQDYQAWHDGGAPTYATFYVPSFLEKAAAFLTAPCFVTGLISNEKTALEARDACAKTGAEFWWYGTGSYVNPFPQEGFMFHNRYGAGLLFWKTGAKCEATWTFCRPHEDVFNDFDGTPANGAEPKEQVTAYPHLLKPDDYSTWQGTIPSIAWESLREGVEDYYYLYTLTQLIQQAQASNSAAAKQAGADAQAELDALVNTVPWANPMGGVAFEAKRLAQVRQAVANRIVALQATLNGQALAPGQEKAQKFTLKVKTSEAAAGPSVPTLVVPRASAAPPVDGALDDAAWKTATVAGPFRDIRDGTPANVATKACVMADDQALYVSFDCPEPAMDKVVAKETQRDGQVWLEDGVEVFVRGAGREPYVHVILTTNNVLLDERNQDAAAWDAPVATAVKKRGDGWSAEVALPWGELAKAGVQRGPLMALNVCRSRYTGGDPQTHTAWSATYGGFHVPDRFGLAFLPTGGVALESLELPSRWGRQVLRASVVNATQEAATARVVLDRDEAKAALAPGQRFVAGFPLALYRPGARTLALQWGAAEGAMTQVALPVTVPDPVEVPTTGGLLSPNSTVDVPIRLNLAKHDAARHTLRLQLVSGGHTLTRQFPATARRAVSIPVRVNGPARLRVALVNELGRAVWQSPEYAFMVLPE